MFQKYVSLFLKIWNLSSTKRSYLVTLSKRFIQIWPEREKKFFWLNLSKKNYYDINDREAKKLPQAPVSDRVNLQLNLLMRIIR